MTEPDLAAWLLEQITQDERKYRDTAGDADHQHWAIHLAGDLNEGWIVQESLQRLVECDAKRRIIDHIQTAVQAWQENQLQPGDIGYHEHDTVDTECAISDLNHTLKLLALPYADRAGYRQEWTP